MGKKLMLKISILLLIIGFNVHNPVFASENSNENVLKAEQFVDQSIDLASKGNVNAAQKTYSQFDQTWRKIEDGVKENSLTAYKDIEANMGKVSYAFTLNKTDQVIVALKGLQTVNEKFANGKYPKETLKKQADLSLDDYIVILQQTMKDVKEKNQEEALAGIKHASDSWLSVEGTVVAHSSTVYNDSERDLVAIQAMLTSSPPNYTKAATLLNNMINYLTPLAESSGYTYWDAAMIMIREGLEALLVVVALLSFVTKSGEDKGKKWVWSGVLAGLAVSVILAFIVKFVITSGAFGNNNTLIAGWTGVFAAAMLLYMSYWLHNQSSIADWNRYIREKSQSALSKGKLLSLGTLAFLAVFREGTETVLFYIGMASQIKTQTLLIGFLLGAGILSIIAYLMIFVGVKLPMRPFFMVSSIIVFYLCIKFTGMGIHSLQLAGIIPTTDAGKVPNVEFFALYPSWESVIPQLLLVVLAAVMITMKKFMNKKVIAVKSH